MADENKLINRAIKLARVELNSEEKKRILEDIKDIEKLFSNLDSCKVDEIKEIGLQGVDFSSLRDDVVVKNKEFDLLAEAKEKEGRFVKGPRI